MVMNGKIKDNSRNRGGFKRIIEMMVKEFKLIKTDIPNLFIALIAPPLIIILFSIMISFTTAPSPINVIMVSYDSNNFFQENASVITTDSDYTPPLIDSFNQSSSTNLKGFYNATEYPYAMDDAYDLLYSGQVDAIIVVPVEFSEFLKLDYPGLLESIPDASELLDVQTILNSIQDAVDLFIETNNLTPFYLDKSTELYMIPEGYNADFNYNMGLVMPFMMMGISMVLTILVVVQEKPTPRLTLTPVKKSEILASKYMTYTILLGIQSTAVLITSITCGLYTVANPMILFGALFLLGFSGIALGIFISTLSNTKTEANQLFFAFFIILFLLSGIFIPITSMPPFLQVIAYSLPLAHGAPVIDAITTKGLILWPNILMLGGISVTLILLAFIIIQKKRLEV